MSHPASLAELEVALEGSSGWSSLEDLLTSPDGFGLTEAMPVQRAACWVLQDNTIPDHLWADETVQEAFGGVRPMPRAPQVAREVLFLAGIRGGKTLISAAAILWFALNARLDVGPGQHLKKGERPRASLVSARLDNAEEAYRYLQGVLTEQPRLMPLLVGKPRMSRLTVRHPSGRLIDIKVVAMSGGQGVNLVSRWCVAVLFDEAPRIASGDEDGKINLKGMISGVRARMLHGAPIILVGSPVGAIGYCYNLFSDNFGKEDNKVTVIKAKGRWLNPTVWTAEKEQATKEQDEDTWRTDCEAEFRDYETQFFSTAALESCFRKSELVRPPVPGRIYSAWMDPGTRRNAWTLLVSETSDNVRFDVVLAMEWQGSQAAPLNSIDTLTQIRDICLPYGITTVASDQFAVDPIRDIARTVGLQIHELTFTAQNKFKRYKSIQTRVNAGFISLPYSEEFRADMLNVKLLLLSNGDPKIKLVQTADGRHCDFAASLALLCGGYLEESDEEGYVKAQKNLPDEDDEQFGSEFSTGAAAAREWNGEHDFDGPDAWGTT